MTLVLSAAEIVVLVSFVCPLVDEDKRLVKASWWEGLAVGKPRSCSGGQGCAHFSSVRPLSHIHLSATPWSAIHQASLSIINTQSLLTLMSIKSVMLPHPVVPFSFCLQPIQVSGSFLMSQFFTLGGQSIRVSCSISPSKDYSRMISFKIDWFDVLAVQGTLKSLLQHHSSKHQLFSAQLFHGPTLTSKHDYWKNHSFDKMDLCRQSNVFAF